MTLRLALLEISCDLKDQIRHEQSLYKELQDRRVSIAFSLEDDGLIRFRQRICVPKGGNLKGQILEEAHKSKFSIHPGATKMYQDLKERFWWPGMKRDVAEYVAKCLTCQKVKIEHQKPAGMLQPLEIPE